MDVEIDFAWCTFRWDPEAFEKAHVHCVVIGFHAKDVNGGAGRPALPNDGASARPVGRDVPAALNVGASARPVGCDVPAALNDGTSARPVGCDVPAALNVGASARLVGRDVPVAPSVPRKIIFDADVKVRCFRYWKFFVRTVISRLQRF